jgi:hypothetical protein
MISVDKTKPTKWECYLDYKKRPPEERGVDQSLIQVNGLKTIIINDRDANFIPIISFN